MFNVAKVMVGSILTSSCIFLFCGFPACTCISFRVAQNEELVEKLTPLDGLRFILGLIVQCKKMFRFFLILRGPYHVPTPL